MTVQTNKVIAKFRMDYQVSPFLIKKTHLDFQLFEHFVLVKSNLQFHKNPEHSSETLPYLELDGIDIELVDIKLNGQALDNKDYQCHQKGLTIKKVSKTFDLETTVKIYPQQNTSLEGLYTSNKKFCTQCESEGFRKITYYLDRPDVMSEYTVRVEGNKNQYPLLLSNGNPINQGEIDGERHFVEWHDPFPKPSYLFALVAGDLDCLEDQFITCSGKKVLLQIFVDKGKLEQCAFAMQSLINSMRWDENRYGREYDLDRYMIVAVSDFNMGAMENKGLNIFNTAYVLANEKTATDKDFEGVECVIGHEYFHNWTGNRITCRDWFQLSLKEGLTVFRDQQFSEDMQSKHVQRIEQVKVIRSAQFAEDSGPMAHSIRPDSYIEMNNFYTVTVYNKGAEVIRMMHTMLGEAGFRKGMDHYFTKHDGQAVTCEDFIVAMEEANNVDWLLFRNWYRQAGTPRVSMKYQQLKDNKIQLTFSQTCMPTPEQSKKAPFMIPINIGFLDKDGSAIEFHTVENPKKAESSLIVLTEETQSFEFNIEGIDVIPSVFRNFSSPIIFDYEYDNNQLAILFAHDKDPFNRWDAGQTVMTRFLTSHNDQITNDELNLLTRSFNNILSDDTLDYSLKSLALQTPDLASAIANAEHIDLDRLFVKSSQLKSHLASSLESHWFSVYQQLNNELRQVNQSSGSNQSNSGKRQFKNLCLSYLLLANEKKYISLAENQQNNATNMTDEISALQLIAKTNHLIKPTQIQNFLERWQNEDLVLDKWFSAQVMRNSDKTVDTVKNLFQHESFSIENPNKVRAVVGTFVANNHQQFHNANGSGYELCGDLIIKLNKINPQIGARLTKYFTIWKKLDGKRQALIKEQLDRILQLDHLSKDIFEIAKKSSQ